MVFFAAAGTADFLGAVTVLVLGAAFLTIVVPEEAFDAVVLVLACRVSCCRVAGLEEGAAPAVLLAPVARDVVAAFLA